MTNKIHLNWTDIEDAAVKLANRNPEATAVYGVPRGGVVPAVLVSKLLGAELVGLPGPGTLIVDDLVDSGSTAKRWVQDGYKVDTLFRKPSSPADLAPMATELDGWLVFPWEVDTDEENGPTDAVVRLLNYIGEDPNREGLLDTPKRVVKALYEMTRGMTEDPVEVLGTTFDVDGCDELIVVSGIHFDSLCEHHLLPFSGTAAVGYLPGERIVGLSKLARLVECYGRRPQVQERMTTQIANAIMEVLGAQAAGVVIKGSHSCMSCRGVRKKATMTTSAMFGRLRTEPVMRAEFFALIGD